MSKEIGRREYKGKMITKNGKYWGYPNDIESSSVDREWRDNPSECIIFNCKLDDVNKVYIPKGMNMDGAELIPITKIIIINQNKDE